MTRVLFFLIYVTLAHVAIAQKYTTEKAHISFFSDAAIEDIEAINTIVGSIFNATTGDLVYIIKIRDFTFHKSLMREHFNEKYMESEKFPKSTFQGKIVGFKPNTPGEQKVMAIGKLSIHGVTRDIEVPGTVELSSGKLLVKSKFLNRSSSLNWRIIILKFPHWYGRILPRKLTLKLILFTNLYETLFYPSWRPTD
jgi:hypothetical protein